MPSELNVVGVPRAIREIIDDSPLRDREDMRAVTAPSSSSPARETQIHPAEVAGSLPTSCPTSSCSMFGDGTALYVAIPSLVARVSDFLTA